MAKKHTVEKIGGTSMSQYCAVRDNIILKKCMPQALYQRIFVVSAYAGITDQLLEHKKSGKPGVFALFANSVSDDSWQQALLELKSRMLDINKKLFGEGDLLRQANQFIENRLHEAEQCLLGLQGLCQHGHFALDVHLNSVREMLASVGEAHSAWNTAHLLQCDGVNACFVDLTGWSSNEHITLDQRIQAALSNIDLNKELPIVTGYAHCQRGLMKTFDRGYSEMIFSRIAVLTNAAEAVIHKEFHLSSADPSLVGEQNAVPIGRTNYDVADQLANLGMEAIHPKAGKGLRQSEIPLRVKNAFEPEHTGTLITRDYVSNTPCVEIVAGCKGVYAVELFDQNMTTDINHYEQIFLSIIKRFKVHCVSKDLNANTITHYVSANLKTIKRMRQALQEAFPEGSINQQKVSIVSAVGSDMQIRGILAKAVAALAEHGISVLAVHQCMRQVDIQFVIDEKDYEQAVTQLHKMLIEVHDHGRAICLAS